MHAPKIFKTLSLKNIYIFFFHTPEPPVSSKVGFYHGVMKRKIPPRQLIIYIEREKGEELVIRAEGDKDVPTVLEYECKKENTPHNIFLRVGLFGLLYMFMARYIMGL